MPSNRLRYYRADLKRRPIHTLKPIDSTGTQVTKHLSRTGWLPQCLQPWLMQLHKGPEVNEKESEKKKDLHASYGYVACAAYLFHFMSCCVLLLPLKQRGHEVFYKLPAGSHTTWGSPAQKGIQLEVAILLPQGTRCSTAFKG